jgi:hypothetical protein
MDEQIAKKAIEAAPGVGRFWDDWNMWVLVMIAVTTLYAKHLLKGERLDYRKLVGEAILTVVGTIGIYGLGLLRGFSPTEIVVYGTLMSLGGVRALQWAIQGTRTLRGME